MGTKRRRQQPRPKHKKIKVEPKRTLDSNVFDKMRETGRCLLESLPDEETINKTIVDYVSRVESYFKKYDTIQLLGSIGLYLIDNVNNTEKSFMSKINNKPLELDEDAEVLAEYAMNFGLALHNNSKVKPSDEVVTDLRESLRALVKIFGLKDMPRENDSEKWLSWVIHSEFIAVRGDGYQCHVEEVFRELFYPHSPYMVQQYGYTMEQLYDFLTKIEDRIVCKIGSQNMVRGVQKMHERWIEWEERVHGNVEDSDFFDKMDFSKGIFVEFFEANPDVPTTVDKTQFLMYQPDDYTGSELVFWVYPQDDTETKVMESLCMSFGENASFLADGDYKGNIMNGHSIFERPFVKVGDRFYCFTPMIPHRNLFLIAEKLLMRNNAFDHYYDKSFKQQSSPIGRDNYIERKVRSVLELFLPNVTFRSSVHYKVTENGIEKKPELDMIGVSDKATYIIEVKAHELTRNDRVKVKGTFDKFKNSAVEACYQCNRAKTSIMQQDRPQFSNNEGVLTIDKSKPIYKIAVTFQHYSMLVGNFRTLVEAGLIKEEYRDTLIVSLFDLMIIADFIQSEDVWVEYLNMHKAIYEKDFYFNDEIDLLNGFLNYNLAERVYKEKAGFIMYGTKEIDEEYSGDLLTLMNDV